MRPLLRPLTAAAALLGAGACVDSQPLVPETTSFRVELLSPADPGSQDARLPDDARSVEVEVTAIDSLGEVDPYLAGEIDVYTYFLGTLTPEWQGYVQPLKVPLWDGKGTATLELPVIAYGPTYLWVEDARGEDPTWATGTSPTLWYRDPFLDDVSRPLDETRMDALSSSPLEGKQVRVYASKHGAAGHLIVTGVYTAAYTLSDADCRATPCTADPYAHIYVYTFGAPRGEDGEGLAIGDLVSWVSGGVSEFNGLTELGFPRTALVKDDAGATVNDESLLPAPVVLDKDWLVAPDRMIPLEQVESGLLAVEGGTICPLDDEWDTYFQWKLDVGWGCGNAINVITKENVFEFEPGAHVGEIFTRVVGTLRSVNIGSFNVWILYPRRSSDVQP